MNFLLTLILSFSVGSTDAQMAVGDDQKFTDVRQTLAGEFKTLFNGKPTGKQLAAWEKKNASLLESQQALTQTMGLTAALEPPPAVAPPALASGASPNLKDLLTTQAALAQAQGQIHQALVNSLPMKVTETQVQEMQANAIDLLQTQQAATLQAQSVRIEALGQEARPSYPRPAPTVLTPQATTEQRALGTLRDQLKNEQVAWFNQYRAAASSVRNTAFQQWIKQNQTRLNQLSQTAGNLSSAN